MAKPPTLRTITAADLKNLQIDDAKRHLYWNGERVRSQIELTWPQTFIAAVGVIAGLATILNGLSSGLNNASTLVCSRGGTFPVIGCAVQTVASTTSTSPAQAGQGAGPSNPATPPATAPEARPGKVAAPGVLPSPPPAPGASSASGH